MSPTPLAALGGGALIGAAAAVVLVVNGQIAGVSGMLGVLVRPRGHADRIGEPPSASTVDGGAQPAAFLTGLVAGGLLWLFLRPETVASVDSGLPLPWLVLAGALVGVGTQVGAGCTSGHGVCGVGRGSPRSIAATATFMAMGAVATFLVHHLWLARGAR